MTKTEKFTPTPTTDDSLDWPQNFLWVRHEDHLTAIDGDWLCDLLGGETPETATEELLANDPEWLRIYLAHCLGVWPITVPAGGPLHSGTRAG